MYLETKLTINKLHAYINHWCPLSHVTRISSGSWLSEQLITLIHTPLANTQRHRVI